MKILFLNHSDSKESLQGAQIALIELVEQWKRKNSKIQPVFISIGEHGKFSEYCSQKGWQCFVLPLDWWLETKASRIKKFRSSQLLSDLSSITQVRQIIREVNPSLCFTNTITCPWLAFASSAEEVPHIWSCHESGDFNNQMSFRYGMEASYQIIGELSQLVIANSTSTHKFLLDFIPEQRISIHPPVRSEDTLNLLMEKSPQQPNHSEVTEKSTSFRIGCFGAVNHNKNQQLLFEALSPISLSGMEFELVIVGNIEEKYWSSLTKSSIFNDISKKIIVLDPTTNPLPIMCQCDLIVSTSINESFGMSIFESQFAGVPVVSTPHLGAIEIIQNGITGTILESFTSEELSKAILTYMNSKDLAEQQGKMAASEAREKLTQFSEQKIRSFELMEKLFSVDRQMTIQAPLNALLNQVENALPQTTLTKLSGLMGLIKVQKKFSPAFLYRVLKSRFGVNK